MLYRVTVYRPDTKSDGFLETVLRVEARSAVEACHKAAPGYVHRGPYTLRAFLPDNAHFQRNETGTKGVCAVAMIPFTGRSF